MTLELTDNPDHARLQPARRPAERKLTGQKPALKAKEVWAIRTAKSAFEPDLSE